MRSYSSGKTNVSPKRLGHLQWQPRGRGRGRAGLEKRLEMERARGGTWRRGGTGGAAGCAEPPGQPAARVGLVRKKGAAWKHVPLFKTGAAKWRHLIGSFPFFFFFFFLLMNLGMYNLMCAWLILYN
ncbi:hypothetical protein ACJIZ3_014789 [Penstemon smallii]|uniref:Uncharacterized protein n=1 Tax=Penstemon smallii TaxID=265156 RepID=A0ABD3RS82_9LAMI